MKKKLIIIIAAVVVLAGAAAAVFFFVLPGKGSDEPAPEYRSTYTPGDYFITNTKGTGNHLIKTTVLLEINVKAEDTKTHEELAAQNHIIRETIVMVLRSHTYDELMGVDMEDLSNFLNTEIVSKLNEKLVFTAEDVEITRIYLYDYYVQ